MKIAIFGMGYVGTVTAACLAARGHQVCGIDTQQGKLEAFRQGKSPVIEPGLDALISEGMESGRIKVTGNTEEGLSGSDVSIVCVGTPSLAGGRPDLKAVSGVAEVIAAWLRKLGRTHEVMFRSTMPPGCTRRFATQVFGDGAHVFFAPEFLREGSALEDFEHPTLSVLGSDKGGAARDSLSYSLLPGKPELMSWDEAEMVKYACNFWHAVKVGFGNEIGRLSAEAGLDGRRVMDVFCQDTELNISRRYLRPGNPFGGSCLPKDVLALVSLARQSGVVAPLLENTMATNAAHTEYLLSRVEARGVKRIGILGLTFKPGTDDLRNSPMISVAEALIGNGAEIRIHDPLLQPEALVGGNLKQAMYRLPALADLMVGDAGEVLDWAELVIAFHPCVPDGILKRHARPDLVVLDVNGWDIWRELPVQYEGLCW